MKNILDLNEINNTRFTIFQVSKVKEEWESLNLSIKCINKCSSNVTLDTFSLVKKEISYSTINLLKNIRSTVQLSLKLIMFGMSSTLLTFGEKYLEYGEKGIESKGLAIGPYKSDFSCGPISI